MTNLEKALASYRISQRHSASIGEDTRSLHICRKTLLRNGKNAQAAALRRIGKKTPRD
ncbi:MAG: hypothetical protein R3228_16270 [Halioglobus sp.]|nr:hypothetical protein [Halioglobus sp.]